MSKTAACAGKAGIKNGIKTRLQDRTAGSRLYLLALSIFLCEETLTTTMFPVPGKILVVCKGLTLLLVIGKILLFEQYARRLFWTMAVIMGIGLLIAASSGYAEPFLWIVMVFGAKDVPWRKILQVWLLISFCVVFLAFCASLLGVIENLQYSRENTVQMRNSFGIMYTTDFASHIFSLILVIFYLLKEKIQVWHYIAAIVTAYLVYRFCYTRLDVGCIILLIILFIIINLWHQNRTLTKKYRARANGKWIWFMPVAALFMVAASVLYSSDSSIMYKLNILASDRLSLAHQALRQYGISPFGQYIDMVGNGGTTIQIKEYFFVDCSYLYVLLQYGAIFLLVVLGAYVLCCKKYYRDKYFLAAVIVISINCMIAHHLIELAYNPFALALFANAAQSGKPGSFQMKWKGRYAGRGDKGDE